MPHDSAPIGPRKTSLTFSLPRDAAVIASLQEPFISPAKYLLPARSKYASPSLGLISITFEKSLGQDYAKTLYIWRKNFFSKWHNLEGLGFKKDFQRLWEFYLTYCEEGFKANTINVHQFLLKKIHD